MFWICFVVCFVCFAIRTLYNYLNYREHKIAAKKGVITAIYFVMFILWYSWGMMNFNDPVSLSLPLWLRLIGLLLFITGVLLFIFAHVGMGRLRNEGKFITKGIYSKFRNPMYLGFIIWVIGFPVFMESMLTLASAVLWIAHFMTWKTLEEKDLERRFEDYREYKARTWF
jgi:protein-S-isoprenylcysteine O-methyltransferase Ste14